ncbi:uncharacterized protein LOC114916682 [Cajanus cajan]|uniref:uncharacterized protein LOC114916682 n=1 Tax=Cajanus cajan TaxID=3821 RepID=UPI0010FB1521|nr:uncharacterized protein LOC114916682 [Cajanus cajan]
MESSVSRETILKTIQDVRRFLRTDFSATSNDPFLDHVAKQILSTSLAERIQMVGRIGFEEQQQDNILPLSPFVSLDLKAFFVELALSFILLSTVDTASCRSKLLGVDVMQGVKAKQGNQGLQRLQVQISRH